MSRKPDWARPEVSLPASIAFHAMAVPRRPLSSSVASPVIEQETRERPEVDLPWQVVVHNDPVNLMSYVTMVFEKVLGFNREKAEQHMMEVHQQGRSVVWSGLRERAELYVQQLHGYLLLATLERVN
ncbi:MAG: ATP-dependent Clp protease adapter ClpS [Chthoniobacterales bacterium]